MNGIIVLVFFLFSFLNSVNADETVPPVKVGPAADDYQPPQPYTPPKIRYKADERIFNAYQNSRPPKDQREVRIGECFKPDGEDNFANRKIRPWLVHEFARIKLPPKAYKYDGGYKTLATVHDYFTIDILARTMMAEIGGTDACWKDADYIRALARLILNRADKANSTDPNIRSAFSGYVRQTEDPWDANPIIPASLHPYQFDVWTGKSPANLWAACPSRSTKIWPRILAAAEEAVLKPDRLRNTTPEMEGAYHYTDGPLAFDQRHCEGYTLRTGVTLDGKPIGNMDCFNLWNEPRPGLKISKGKLNACVEAGASARAIELKVRKLRKDLLKKLTPQEREKTELELREAEPKANKLRGEAGIVLQETLRLAEEEMPKPKPKAKSKAKSKK